MGKSRIKESVSGIGCTDLVSHLHALKDEKKAYLGLLFIRDFEAEHNTGGMRWRDTGLGGITMQ